MPCFSGGGGGEAPEMGVEDLRAGQALHGCDSVVLRPPALDGDSWVFVLEIHVQLG